MLLRRRALVRQCQKLMQITMARGTFENGTSKATPFPGGGEEGKRMSAELWGVGAALVATWGMTRAEAEVATPLSESKAAENYTPWWREFSFLSLETRKKMFFKYEKRIRSLSTPEKVFEYFSSIEQDGVKYMTAADLLRALVPVYPPEGSPMERGGALMGEKVPQGRHTMFLHVFDMDGDDLISFHEYLMVLTLLSIPLSHIQVVFDIVDKDGNGVIDRNEFEVVLNHIKKQSRQANKSRGGMRTGLKVGENAETAGLLVKFFGKDGTEKLKLPEFKAFLEDLQSKLLLLEFMHYDYGNKRSIKARDFARSLIAAANVSTLNTYLNRVRDMDESLSSCSVGVDDFVSFYSIVNHLAALETALRFIESSHGRNALTAETLKSTIKRLTGIDIPRALTQIVVYVFGDGNGILDIEAFIRALDARARH